MRTVLYDRHCALGAKMVSFAGWEMPVLYKSVITEHRAVRESVGLFDVSHMGRITVEGPDAEKVLEELSVNVISGKTDGTVIYTVWCHENGGSVDDVMIYRESSFRFFIVVNAGNRQKDLDHLLRYSRGRDLVIKDRYHEDGILALQGPQAKALLSGFFPEIENLKPMHFLKVQDRDKELIISRTGYTGAGGFELYGENASIAFWWDKCLEIGKPFSIEPIGLGARDTLRLEMGFALYGHELNDTISPNESVAAWTIHRDKDFLGKQALLDLETSSRKRFAYGVKLSDKGIAREGFPVFKDGTQIGYVTSGSFSPVLNQPIALILVNVPLMTEEVLTIRIRDKQQQALVTELPFIRKHS